MPAAPKEQALNYLKGKRAARLKIKEEKTFQRELFTGHDSRASDVPLQPGSCLQNTPCFFSVLFCVTVQPTSPMPFDPAPLLVLLSLLRRQHRPLFVTSQSCSGFSPWPFLRRRIQAPDGGNDICSPQKSGRDGESCHLAKPSGALYASDLHVSTCSKYNPLAFVDELRALRLPEGEMGGRGAREAV